MVLGSVENLVRIEGYVKRSGEYDLVDKMKIYDLFFSAGGINDSTYIKNMYLDRADLIRVDDLGYENIIRFNCA